MAGPRAGQPSPASMATPVPPAGTGTNDEPRPAGNPIAPFSGYGQPAPCSRRPTGPAAGSDRWRADGCSTRSSGTTARTRWLLARHGSSVRQPSSVVESAVRPERPSSGWWRTARGHRESERCRNTGRSTGGHERRGRPAGRRYRCVLLAVRDGGDHVQLEQLRRAARRRTAAVARHAPTCRRWSRPSGRGGGPAARWRSPSRTRRRRIGRGTAARQVHRSPGPSAGLDRLVPAGSGSTRPGCGSSHRAGRAGGQRHHHRQVPGPASTYCRQVQVLRSFTGMFARHLGPTGPLAQLVSTRAWNGGRPAPASGAHRRPTVSGGSRGPQPRPISESDSKLSGWRVSIHARLIPTQRFVRTFAGNRLGRLAIGFRPTQQSASVRGSSRGTRSRRTGSPSLATRSAARFSIGSAGVAVQGAQQHHLRLRRATSTDSATVSKACPCSTTQSNGSFGADSSRAFQPPADRRLPGLVRPLAGRPGSATRWAARSGSSCRKSASPRSSSHTPGRRSAPRRTRAGTGVAQVEVGQQHLVPGLGQAAGQPERGERLPLVPQRAGDGDGARPAWPARIWATNARSLSIASFTSARLERVACGGRPVRHPRHHPDHRPWGWPPSARRATTPCWARVSYQQHHPEADQGEPHQPGRRRSARICFLPSDSSGDGRRLGSPRTRFAPFSSRSADDGLFRFSLVVASRSRLS